MSATSSQSQSISIEATAASPAEISASCRAAVLFLFMSSAVWLVISSVLGLLATMTFHGMVADCPMMSYGRMHPAAINALVYGFGIQAGLGVALWLVSQLGRTKLTAAPVVVAGAILWNLGVTLGLLSIFGGENTGYEWMEMPRISTSLLFFGYLAMGVSGMVTFHRRSDKGLYISQWFLLAALFWFPWIYSTAKLLLVVKPMRGVLQAVVDRWYIVNLTNIWFGLIGLAAAFYFIPKFVKRPLHSQYLGIFTFWTLIIFGSWGGIPAGSPLPAWMSALSTFASALMVIPILTVLVNVKNTASCADTKGAPSVLKYFQFGILAYVVAGLMNAATGLGRVSKITNFTWYLPAQTQLFLYGFFAITMLGAIYYIAPQLTGMEFGKSKLICANFALSMFGVLIYALPLAIGGVLQGLALNDIHVPFIEVVKSSLMFVRVSSFGELLMLAGNLLLFVNLLGLCVRHGKSVVVETLGGTGKTAEVTS